MHNVPSASTDDYWLPGAVPRQASRSRVALQFFALGSATVCGAGLIAWGLMQWLGRSTTAEVVFPAAFAISTALLACGSLCMLAVLRAVRRERQATFRRNLRRAVAISILFMGVQTYALWTIVPPDRSPMGATTGAAPFMLMLATLHGLHFLVATLFVSFVAVQARNGRYDHEYHWGVSICVWFWHALGVVWLAILTVYTIAAL